MSYIREIEENKELDQFLKSLYNSKTGTYKKVCISPLRYAGGKSRAIGLILENLPVIKNKKIISLFFGGGSFEIFMSQELDYEIIGYDVFDMLCNFWNTIIDKNTKSLFIKKLEEFKIDKEEFKRNRHILLNYWEKIKPSDLVYKTKEKFPLTETEKHLLDNDTITQSVYYYYNMILSYGPMFLGWPSSNELTIEKFKRRIEKLKTLELKNLTIKCSRFEEIIDKHIDDFLYLDPPYLLGDDSRMFKGMYPNCNFAIHHNNFNHELLRDKLKLHKGGFILTYNDCPTIREWYKDYHLVFPKWQYSYGQGEKRIGKNRKETETNIKESHEIFIICPSYTI